MVLGIFSLINFFICLRNTNWSKAFDIQASILSSKFTVEMAAVFLVTTTLLCLLFEKPMAMKEPSILHVYCEYVGSVVVSLSK